MKISCVVPAYNEEKNLKKLVEELIPVLESHEETKDYEIILVNDNSTDNTPSIIDTLANENPRIKPVHRASTPGFGNAIKSGLKHASGDIVIPVMGNLSDDQTDLLKLVKKIEEGYDIAYGSRFIKGSSVEDYPITKIFANRIFNNVVRFLFGISHKDVTNAFKAYKRKVLETIGIENMEAEGFDLTVEIPLKAHILGFKSAEVPVNWYGRKRGIVKLKLSENALVYGKRLLKLFFWGNLVALRDLFSAVIKGSWISVLVAILIGFFILAGIFTFSGFSEVFGILRSASLYWILFSCSTIFLSFLLRTWRWSVILRSAGFVASRDMVFKCIMFGWLLNYLLPARLGDIARGIALKTTERVPLGMGLSTIVLERIFDIIALAVLLALPATLFYQKQFLWLEVISVGLVVALTLVLFLVYKFDEYIVRVLKGRVPKIKDSISLLKKGLDDIRNSMPAMAFCFALSIPIWLFEISSLFFAAKAINFDIPFLFATVSGIAAFIAQALPVTPAGIGVHEASITGVLALFGVPTSTGVSIALVDHFARGLIIYIFGLISAIHIGFASRGYFKRRDEMNKDGDG
ncbi:MAG: flippase-like domain-containing protein [Methanocellales archaeon]|nr:flippase-like domain-containing protein [Methanocellales archaeon]